MPANVLDSPLVVSVLGLLAEGPSHIYRIATTLGEQRGAPISRGTLRHLVAAMEREGWVDPLRTERDGARPERIVLALTGKGWTTLAARVDATLRNPAPEPSRFSQTVAYLGALSPAVARSAIVERIDKLQQRRHELEVQYQDARERHGVRRLHLIATECVLHQLRSEITWLTALHEEIVDGRLAWPDAIGTTGHADRDNTRKEST